MNKNFNFDELSCFELKQDELLAIDGGGLPHEIGRAIGYTLAGIVAFTEAVRESNSQIAWYNKK